MFLTFIKVRSHFSTTVNRELFLLDEWADTHTAAALTKYVQALAHNTYSVERAASSQHWALNFDPPAQTSSTVCMWCVH